MSTEAIIGLCAAAGLVLYLLAGAFLAGYWRYIAPTGHLFFWPLAIASRLGRRLRARRDMADFLDARKPVCPSAITPEQREALNAALSNHKAAGLLCVPVLGAGMPPAGDAFVAEAGDFIGMDRDGKPVRITAQW